METPGHILVDRAREKKSAKRGGSWRRLVLDHAELSIDDPPDGILDLDEALVRLEAEHPTKAKLVKLRFFAGISQREAADALGMSLTTADRHWFFARTWLYRELSRGTPPGDE